MGSLTHFGYLSFILVSKPLENTISNAFSHDMPVIIIIIIKHTPKNRCKESIGKYNRLKGASYIHKLL